MFLEVLLSLEQDADFFPDGPRNRSNWYCCTKCLEYLMKERLSSNMKDVSEPFVRSSFRKQAVYTWLVFYARNLFIRLSQLDDSIISQSFHEDIFVPPMVGKSDRDIQIIRDDTLVDPESFSSFEDFIGSNVAKQVLLKFNDFTSRDESDMFPWNWITSESGICSKSLKGASKFNNFLSFHFIRYLTLKCHIMQIFYY